jgi:cytochrome c-type biogenesis protein CcmH
MAERFLARILSVLLLGVCVPLLAWAQTALPNAADPALEARVMVIAEELRCLVCQNETIAASHAELAVDLRQQIRSQLQQGRTAQEILDFMSQRYGDFVLYRPPWQSRTLLLWLGPFLLLAWAVWVVTRRMGKRGHDAPAPLSPQEAARAAQLLSDRVQP